MENILNYIALYLPIVLAVLSEVGVILTVLTKVKAYFKTAEENVKTLKETAEYKQLKTQMKIVLEENIELKKKLNIVMEKLTHVKVQDETISNNK